MNLNHLNRLVLDEMQLCKSMGCDEAETARRIVSRLNDAGALDDGETRDHP